MQKRFPASEIESEIKNEISKPNQLPRTRRRPNLTRKRFYSILIGMALICMLGSSRAHADSDVVVFASTATPMTVASYSVQDFGIVTHLICDLYRPGDYYDVYRNGNKLPEHFTVNASGCLSFESIGGGSFFVARSDIQPRKARLGIFYDGYWYIDASGDGQWDAWDQWFGFGSAGDNPIVGDWNGDGFADAGVFRNGSWYLDSDGNGMWGGVDRAFGFGMAGDLPVVGDWNGDGLDDVGVFRDGYWYLDSNGSGVWDVDDIWIGFGMAGDLPAVGDYNGDGIDDIGVFRNGTWSLDSNGSRAWDAGDEYLTLGTAGDLPVVADWNGDGDDDIAIYRDGYWYIDANDDGTWDANDEWYVFGSAGYLPIIGNW